MKKVSPAVKGYLDEYDILYSGKELFDKLRLLTLEEQRNMFLELISDFLVEADRCMCTSSNATLRGVCRLIAALSLTMCTDNFNWDDMRNKSYILDKNFYGARDLVSNYELERILREKGCTIVGSVPYVINLFWRYGYEKYVMFYFDNGYDRVENSWATRARYLIRFFCEPKNYNALQASRLAVEEKREAKNAARREKRAQAKAEALAIAQQ